MLLNFLIDAEDRFIHPNNADCYTVLSGASTAAVKEGMKAENVKPIDNFFPFLCSQIDSQIDSQFLCSQILQNLGERQNVFEKSKNEVFCNRTG